VSAVQYNNIIFIHSVNDNRRPGCVRIFVGWCIKDPSLKLACTARSGKLTPTNDAQHGVGVNLPDLAVQEQLATKHKAITHQTR